MTGGRAAGARVSEFAPAKINLYLHLTGRRADGYHLLSSLVVFAEIGDRLTVSPGTGLRLAVEGPFAAALPVGEDNLVVRAARRLAAEAGVAPDAEMRLVKRLPVAAGIGGGSADAAAALRALAALWRVAPGAEALARLGLELGADVPVCLRGSPALVSGVGEALAPAPELPAAWLVLVNPGVGLVTRDVFAARTGPYSPAAPLLDAPRDAVALARALAARHNDLAAPAQSLAPVVGDVLAALEAAPGCLLARVSGSGATCFGLFAAVDPAQAAARRIAAARPDWWCVAAAIGRR